MNSIDSLISLKDLIVLDGPMGTELERRGYDVNDALWSAKFLKENPEAIKQIHYDYFEAGADIVTCASYQASIDGFGKAGYSKEEAEELIAKSIELVRSARDEWWEKEGKDSGRPYPLAAGDIGPYGAYLADGSEYTGTYHLSEEKYRAFHFPRMKILKDAGAEIFAVETCPRLDEAVYSARMLEELDSDYWVSFTFRNGEKISEGKSIAEIVEALKDFPHLKAIGVNCTPPEYVNSIVRQLKAESDIPICVYPNSGEVYDGNTKTWSGAADGKTYAERAAEWYSEGAAIIGGCCRTRPEDIRSVAEIDTENITKRVFIRPTGRKG